MRYKYEFKIKCTHLYRKGIWVKTPKNVKTETFRQMIKKWARIEDIHGSEGLKHPKKQKIRSPEEKLEIVSKVLAGNSIISVAISAGISEGMLHRWVQSYKIFGYNGLINKNKRIQYKEEPMKKNRRISVSKPLNESEREELNRLKIENEHMKAENEYIKAENEIIKKEIALREEKAAARLKARKRRLSKNLEKKDIN